MSKLELKGISKQYQKKMVLNPLSIEVEKGECLVLSGGNGAGKSTLLNIIAGITSPSCGSVHLNGINIKNKRKKYVENIGYMPDDFQPDLVMTVKEFLLFYASLRKVEGKRVEEVISLVGLEEKANEPIRNLSKGMRQRLIFAQAWLAKPLLLILDEPTNGLDPYWVNEFVQQIIKIKQSGTTVVFSTHMMDVAVETADRILLMKAGGVIEQINGFEKKEEAIMKLIKLQRI